MKRNAVVIIVSAEVRGELVADLADTLAITSSDPFGDPLPACVAVPLLGRALRSLLDLPGRSLV